MSRKITFSPQEWYHCFSRGVDKRRIYMDLRDYRRFLMHLYASNTADPIHIAEQHHVSAGETYEAVFRLQRGPPIVDIGAYALMPNHYHILLRERTEGGITSFMRRLNTGYAMYFNARNERAGALFSARFKALHVAKDSYLRRVVNYIHGNPAELFEHDIKSGRIFDDAVLRKEIAAYEFSSLNDYVHGIRLESSIIAMDALMEHLEERPSVQGIMEDFRTFYAPASMYAKPIWS